MFLPLQSLAGSATGRQQDREVDKALDPTKQAFDERRRLSVELITEGEAALGSPDTRAVVLHDYAAMLLSTPCEELRDPPKAVQAARQAAEAYDEPPWALEALPPGENVFRTRSELDLADMHAEAGDHAKADGIIRGMIERTRASSDDERAEQLELVRRVIELARDGAPSGKTSPAEIRRRAPSRRSLSARATTIDSSRSRGTVMEAGGVFGLAVLRKE